MKFQLAYLAENDEFEVCFSQGRCPGEYRFKIDADDLDALVAALEAGKDMCLSCTSDKITIVTEARKAATAGATEEVSQ